MKKGIIILCILFFHGVSAGEYNYTYIDEKIDVMQSSIISSHESSQKVIEITQHLIQKIEKYKKSHRNSIKIINYIQQDFEIFLDKYKQNNGYINTLIYSEEQGEVTSLEIYKKEFIFKGDIYFTLRKFTQNNIEKYLIFNTGNYETSVIESEGLKDISIYTQKYEESNYKKHQDRLYQKTINIASPYQNNGILESYSDTEDVFLTSDFCPSSKHGFEKEVLEQFIQKGNKNIAIAITSAWIEGHGDDYTWLREKNKSGELNISWVNHTKTHNYDYGVDFSQNFILTPGLSLGKEILDVEEKLLEKAQVPSVFMRFPGLVSDLETRRQVIYDYGLFPLGSNAWLAKGEQPKDGSIILIHGNKNEPAGITIMNNILKKQNYSYGEIEQILQ